MERLEQVPGWSFVNQTVRPDGLHHALTANSRDLLAYLERRVDLREDAADLLGETMLVAWRRITKLPIEPEQARMWLFVIARNTLLNYRRGRRRQLAVATALRAELTTASAPHDTSLTLDVRRAIAELPDDLAELVRLVHWDGFSLADSAALLGIPAATARGRYARARSRLSATLPEYDGSVPS
jgi:RNA polymerase sigma factor (sigma-70 family)